LSNTSETEVMSIVAQWHRVLRAIVALQRAPLVVGQVRAVRGAREGGR